MWADVLSEPPVSFSLIQSYAGVDIFEQLGRIFTDAGGI